MLGGAYRSLRLSRMAFCALLDIQLLQRQYFGIMPLLLLDRKKMPLFYYLFVSNPSSIMSLFTKILTEFNKIKLNEKSKFTEYQINRAMDQLMQLNTSFSEFDRDVAEQLWQHTTKTPQGKVLLKDYIQTIIDARNILKQNIDKCTNQLTFEQDIKQKEELQDCLLSYGEDYRILGEPFILEQLPSKNASFSKSQLERSQQKSQMVSHIFSENTTGKEESTSLKVVLVLTLVLIPFQVLCMFSKDHFLNILCYFSIVAIFALNYFTKNYIKFCEILLATSVILDLLWLIIHSGNYWNPPQHTQYSHLQTGFLKFVYILTILMMVGKVLLAIILFRFTKNTQTTSKFIRFLNQKIYLSGKGEDNPLSRLLAGKKQGAQ